MCISLAQSHACGHVLSVLPARFYNNWCYFGLLKSLGTKFVWVNFNLCTLQRTASDTPICESRFPPIPHTKNIQVHVPDVGWLNLHLNKPLLHESESTNFPRFSSTAASSQESKHGESTWTLPVQMQNKSVHRWLAEAERWQTDTENSQVFCLCCYFFYPTISMGLMNPRITYISISVVFGVFTAYAITDFDFNRV